MHVRFLLPWCFFFSQCGGHRVSFRSEVQGLRPRGRRGRRAHRPPGRGASPGSASTPNAVEGATVHQHPHQRWSLSLQRGGLENCFRSGRYMRCPCFPPIRVLVFTSHVQPEKQVHRLSVASRVLPSHLDRTRGAVVLSRSGWTHSGRPRGHRPTAPCSTRGRGGDPEPAIGAR